MTDAASRQLQEKLEENIAAKLKASMANRFGFVNDEGNGEGNEMREVLQELAKSKKYEWLRPKTRSVKDKFVPEHSRWDRPSTVGYNPPKFSFGAGDRFSSSVYSPHNPRRGHFTPGPRLMLPSTLSKRTVHWGKGTSRKPDPITRERMKTPGPGSYSILPEQKLEEELLLQELADEEAWKSPIRRQSEESVLRHDEADEESVHEYQEGESVFLTEPPSESSATPTKSPSRSALKKKHSALMKQSAGKGSPSLPTVLAAQEALKGDSKRGKSMKNLLSQSSMLVSSTVCRKNTKSSADSMRSMKSTASGILRFGDHPHYRMHRGVSFATSNRAAGHKVHNPGKVDIDALGRDSPGPNLNPTLPPSTPAFSFLGANNRDFGPIQKEKFATTDQTRSYPSQFDPNSPLAQAKGAKFNKGSRDDTDRMYFPGLSDVVCRGKETRTAGTKSRVYTQFGPEAPVRGPAARFSSSNRVTNPISRDRASLPGPGSYNLPR